MPLFLYESLIMFPGKSGEYCTTVVDKYLPLNDDYDSKWLRLSGFFTPDVLYSTQPRIAILWTIPDWEAWGGRMAGSTAEERLRKVQEFMQPAMSLRAGWTDKLLEPLDFSPLPVVRPDSSKSGATVIDHQFLVRPEHCAEFVKVFKDEVLPAAEASGVTLELIARVAGARANTSRSGRYRIGPRTRHGGPAVRPTNRPMDCQDSSAPGRCSQTSWNVNSLPPGSRHWEVHSRPRSTFRRSTPRSETRSCGSYYS